MEGDEDMLTVNDALRLLGVSRGTFFKFMREGRIQPVNERNPLLQRQAKWLFRRRDVLALLQKGRE